MKILVLEDNKDRIKDFRRKFIKDDVVYVDDAQTTIEHLKKTKFDLVCLDHDLGDMSIEYDMENCGTVVAEWIHEHPIEDTKFIIHSLNSSLAKDMVELIPGSKYIPFYWLT